MNPEFWRGRRVFLTGHTGFKGSWLSLWLQDLGAVVTGYALAAPTKPNMFEAARVAEGMRSIAGDIRDASHLERALKESSPDIVFHLAAQSLVRVSYDDPAGTYATNVLGLVNLFEAIRKTRGVRAVVNVTSDKCYDNKEWVWGYREDEAMGGADPYSSSKGCAELVTAAYRKSFFSRGAASERVALGSARAGNVIGGGDWAQDRLVPDIVKCVTRSETLTIRNPDSVRPWQHVLEPLSGYLTLAEHLSSDSASFSEGWNFGPADQDARPVRWIVEKLISLWKSDIDWRVDSSPQPPEAHYLKLDCSKAARRLAWTAKWPLSEALARVVDWHKAHLANEDMRAVSIRQIGAYASAGVPNGRG